MTPGLRSLLTGCAIEGGMVLAGVGIVAALVAAAGRLPFFAPALAAVAAVALIAVLSATALVALTRQITAERVAIALHLVSYGWTWLLTALGEPRRRLARRRAVRPIHAGRQRP